jgi:hypothetical protein
MHQLLRLRQLDWFSALNVNEIASIRGLMAEADPDVIFGADIVRYSFVSITTDGKMIIYN